jgi:putative oxidoreductase
MLWLKQILFGGAGGATLVSDIGLAMFRISIGLMMAIGHGKGKMWGAQGFGPSERFVTSVTNLGFPAPTFFAWCAALAEFLGGLLLAAGVLTRPVALVLCFNMAVAAFGSHAGQGFAKQEPALLYLLAFVLFAFTGAGRFSADQLIRGQRA